MTVCFKSTPKVPAAVPVQPAPSTDTTAAATADQRRRLRAQPSTYGSIFTSVLGDTNYGSNVGSTAPVAALGA